jgi:23S rRNA (cytosine1962-C5)-methyltransferase
MEGNSDLVIDLYATTLVIHNYADDPTQGNLLVDQAIQFLQSALTWLRAGMDRRNILSKEFRKCNIPKT